MDAHEKVNGLLQAIDDTLLNAMGIVDNLDAWRQGADNWGDVGTLAHISAKLDELTKELESYAALRLPDDDEQEV